MGCVVWWLVKQTVNVKPWVSHPATDAVRDTGVQSPITSTPLVSAKLGLGVFLAVATSLFALFISAYAIRMEVPDWRPLTEPGLLWFNSFVLVISSVGLQWAWSAANRGWFSHVKFGLLGGGVCAIGFMVGQLAAWVQLSNSGFLVTGNPANAFFYLLTAVHALHLLGGMVAWGRTVSKVFSGAEPERIRLGVELCAVYWHYLLVVWFILFAVMLST